MLGRNTKLFPLVKPNATSEEIAAVVDNTDGSGDRIFANAVRLVIPAQLNQVYQLLVLEVKLNRRVLCVQGSPGSPPKHPEDRAHDRRACSIVQ